MIKWSETFSPENSWQSIKKVIVRVRINDVKGTILVTDLMLQGGNIPTMWQGHPSEIKWSFDNV